MRRKSQAIQRNLPRPTDMNHNILRPVDMMTTQPLNDYQKAEEMIKEEMLTMLHNDSIKDPSWNQIIPPSHPNFASKKINSINKTNLKPLNYEKHLSYIKEKGGFDEFSPDEINQVITLLSVFLIMNWFFTIFLYTN